MNIGVIFAGGAGTRMRTKDCPKQFLEVFNKPIIIHTLEHFQSNDEVDAIVIACIDGWIPHLRGLVERYRMSKVRDIVLGGATGQLSIYNGLCAAKRLAGDEKSIVIIHDGVRPLISAKLISENIACVKRHGSCITTGIVKETIAKIDGNHRVIHVQSRENSRVAKAPQSFWLDDIMKVHLAALAAGETNSIDSCTLMNQYGYQLTVIDGPYENIKITTPDDFFTMRAILENQENRQIYLPDAD